MEALGSGSHIGSTQVRNGSPGRELRAAESGQSNKVSGGRARGFWAQKYVSSSCALLLVKEHLNGT